MFDYSEFQSKIPVVEEGVVADFRADLGLGRI